MTIELARVLAGSGIDFDATLVFALWAGEEQGLFGSRAHALRLREANVPVEADLNSDIVGNSHGGDGVVDAGSVRLYCAGPRGFHVAVARTIHRKRCGPVRSVAHECG